MSNFKKEVTLDKKELVDIFLHLSTVDIFLNGLNRKNHKEISKTSESCPLFNLRVAMDSLKDKIDLNDYMTNVNINPFPIKEVTND
jgi:hypothetical protein